MKKDPLVLCLTNTVAANFTANCLLAIGAKPAMIDEPSESAELAARADAMLVNLGTVTTAQAETMRSAITVANERGIPWVLDPVAIHLLGFRRQLAFEFISMKPSIIRGNHQETEVILGPVPTVLGPVPTVLGPVPTILSTGSVDRIYSSKSSGGGHSTPLEISGGVPMLQAVTATGCAQGAICAAFLGWGQAPCDACRSASYLMKRAGERAFEKAKTPGSFQVALLDALWELTHD